MTGVGVSVLALAAALPPSLPSWNDGVAKRAILKFVADVGREGGPGYVPPAERIAVFDNDGTLWCEKPIYVQAAFLLDRVQALVQAHPELSQRQPYKAVVENDLESLAALGEKGITELVVATHSGTSTEEFDATVRDWLAAARHPRFDRPYTELAYQPMVELLAFLRANGWKTFIVSGGGIDFMRPWTQRVYGIPPEQVVGSAGKLAFRMRNSRPELERLAGIDFVDDGPGKPVGIHRFIGRRPILSVGNSDGDLQMLQYTDAGSGPRLVLVIHHDDADREYAYDRKSRVGKLDKALDEATARRWTVVSMKRDFAQIFPDR